MNNVSFPPFSKDDNNNSKLKKKEERPLWGSKVLLESLFLEQVFCLLPPPDFFKIKSVCKVWNNLTKRADFEIYGKILRVVRDIFVPRLIDRNPTVFNEEHIYYLIILKKDPNQKKWQVEAKISTKVAENLHERINQPDPNYDNYEWKLIHIVTPTHLFLQSVEMEKPFTKVTPTEISFMELINPKYDISPLPIPSISTQIWPDDPKKPKYLLNNTNTSVLFNIIQHAIQQNNNINATFILKSNLSAKNNNDNDIGLLGKLFKVLFG